MTQRKPCQCLWMRLASLVLVMPFLLLSGFAPGYMPVRASDGTMTVVICAGAGPVQMVVDLTTGEAVPQKAPEDGRCSWAQAGPAIAPSDALPSARPVMVPARFTPVSPDDLWRPAHDPRGLWARGPPATV